MKYLHVVTNDPQANGDSSPSACSLAHNRALFAETAPVQELVREGWGFINELDHVPGAHLERKSYRTEVVTDEQAEAHAKAVKAWEAKHL